MNKRRWTAIGIAAALFIISIIIAFIPEKETKENTLTGINRIFYGSNELIEETLEEGKDNKKIVKLSVEGTSADTGENNLFSKKTYNHQNFLSQIKKYKKITPLKVFYLK